MRPGCRVLWKILHLFRQNRIAGNRRSKRSSKRLTTPPDDLFHARSEAEVVKSRQTRIERLGGQIQRPPDGATLFYVHPI